METATAIASVWRSCERGPIEMASRWRISSLVCVAALLCATGLSAQVPPRPASHILDDLRGLTATESESIQSLLLAAARDEDLHIYMILRRDPLAKTATAAGEEYFRAWGSPNACCLIFHAPDLSDGIDAWLGGALLRTVPAEDLERAARQIRNRAASAKSSPEAAKVAALEALGQLRMLNERLHSVDDPARGVKADPISLNATPVATPVQARTWYQATFLTFGVFLTALAALSAFQWFRRSRTAPRLFPSIEPRVRFQSPFSGGNNAHLDFSDRSKRTR